MKKIISCFLVLVVLIECLGSFISLNSLNNIAEAADSKYTEGTQQIYYYGRDNLVYAKGSYYAPGLPTWGCSPGHPSCPMSLSSFRINADLSFTEVGLSLSNSWGGAGSLGVDDQGRAFSTYAAAIWNDGRSWVYTKTLEDSGSITDGYYNFSLTETSDLDGVFLTKTDGTKIPYISRLSSNSNDASSIFAGTDTRVNWTSYTADPTNTTPRPFYLSYSPITQTIKVGNRIYTTVATSGGGYTAFYEDFDPVTGNLSGLVQGSDGKFPLADLKSSYAAYSPEAIKYNGAGFSYIIVGWPTGPFEKGFGQYYESNITYKETDSSGNVILSVPVPSKTFFPTLWIGTSDSPMEPPEYAVSLNGNYATIATPDPIGGGVAYSVIDRTNGSIVKQASTSLNGERIRRVLSAKNAGDADKAMFLICNDSSMCRALQIPVQTTKLEVVSPAPDQMLSDLDTAFVPTVKVRDTLNGSLTLKYFIDSEPSPRDTKRITNTATEQTVSFNAVNLASLSEGTHTMRFAVDDGTDKVERTLRFVVDKAAPLIGAFQATSTDTTISFTGSASDSVSGLHSVPYRYTIGSEASAWTSSSTYSKTGLTPNTDYSVKFEVMDRVGHVSNRTQTVRTKAQVPAVSVAVAAETSLDLIFTDSNPSGTPYQLKIGNQYVNESGALTTIPNWIVPPNKRLKITGLTPNTSYSLQAKTKNVNGEETAFGSVLNGVTLARSPERIDADASQRWIRLNWPASGGSVTYEVEADGVVNGNGSSNSYLHSSLAPNTKHTYRVRVNNGGGKGAWSEPLSVSTLPDPPAVPLNIQATPSQTEMTIAWDLVARAESYDIEIDGTVFDNGSQISYVHEGLQPLTRHTYRVRAKNTGGIGTWSQPITQQTLPYPPETPDNVKGEPSIHEVSLTWDPSEGATSYELEVDGLIIDNKDSTTYVHTDLEELSGHTYRVRAVNIGGKSAWSKPLNITTHPEKPTTPTNLLATAEERSTTISWYQVPHADGYEIEVDGSNIVSANYPQFVHEGLTPDRSHTYKVRAKNISGASEWSKSVTIFTLPSQADAQLTLTNVAAVVTNRTITLSWDTVAPGAQYEVEVDGKITDIGTDTTFHHGGLQADEFHAYKIRWKNADGASKWVAVLSLSTLPNPLETQIKVSAFATNNSIELRWDKVEGATGYDIEIDGDTVVEGTSTTYAQTELASGTSHTYRVRAKNETGVTAWSDAIVKSTTSPTYKVRTTQGKMFSLSILASNVQDFNERAFIVSYDPSRMEVADLYDFTPQADITAAGAIPGSNLEVKYQPGKIVFRKKQNIVPGTSWSGEVTTLVFRSKVTGESAIDVTVE